jgi:hypothetical protein
MSAILAIFCNILLHPLSPQAKDDLELLRTAPQSIKEIHIQKPTVNEILHMKSIEDFVAELVRLGSHAIMKAHHDQQYLVQQGGL